MVCQRPLLETHGYNIHPLQLPLSQRMGVGSKQGFWERHGDTTHDTRLTTERHPGPSTARRPDPSWTWSRTFPSPSSYQSIPPPDRGVSILVLSVPPQGPGVGRSGEE